MSFFEEQGYSFGENEARQKFGEKIVTLRRASQVHGKPRPNFYVASALLRLRRDDGRIICDAFIEADPYVATTRLEREILEKNFNDVHCDAHLFSDFIAGKRDELTSVVRVS